jgi:hypothetical protein
VVRSGDPVEQEKQLKYASLVANAVMLSNVVDLTEVLSAMAKDGHPVTPALVACISPYIRDHIRRFGRFALDMAELPTPLNPQPGRFGSDAPPALHLLFRVATRTNRDSDPLTNRLKGNREWIRRQGKRSTFGMR